MSRKEQKVLSVECQQCQICRKKKKKLTHQNYDENTVESRFNEPLFKVAEHSFQEPMPNSP